ncbi:sigma-54 dependent transcriptional regulator [soil metagenome]
MKGWVFIIDDEEKLRVLLSKIIVLEGFEVIQAGDCKSALKKLEQNDVDVIICDVKLPDGSGVELTQKIKAAYPTIEIILLTAYGNIPDAVQAITNGAFDYITKGDDNNRIIPLLYRALEKAALAKRVKQLEKQLGKKYSFDNIIGKSRLLHAAIESAKKVAVTDAVVLLTGETGTGKEVFAQAIHNASKRNRYNFVAVNCAAFSKDLLENELFGHKAGSFTGAVKDSKGIFEEANNGTIFLDEIGEMPLELQAKLLRVLESKEFIKIGDTKSIKVNVRIIAATNRDLPQQVKEGYFREDLFYRINVFTIPLPALRDRENDIPLLADHFLQMFIAKTNNRIGRISNTFMEHLLNHDWKGNTRELKNVMERAVILAENNELVIEGLPVELQTMHDHSNTLSAFDLASVEKLHIQRVLNYTKGNKTETAKLLNIGLTTLYRKIEEYHIS